MTWGWNGSAWTAISTPTELPTRSDFAMAYDAARKQVVTFGGYRDSVNLGDTWVLPDSIPKLYFQTDDTRTLSIWTMNGATLASYTVLSVNPAGWRLAGTGDFDGDGIPDLVFQNVSSGAVTVWFMGGADGNTFEGYALLTAGFGADWQIAAIGNFNNQNGAGINQNGPGIAWQNQTTRDVTVWFMSTGDRNPTLLAWQDLATTPGYRLVAVGNFGGSNSGPDLVWQNDSAPLLTMWFMGGASGTTLQSWAPVPLSNSVDTVQGWKVVGARDILGTGRDQIVWYGDNGRFGSLWDMTGVNVNSYSLLQGGATFPGWHLSAR